MNKHIFSRVLALATVFFLSPAITTVWGQTPVVIFTNNFNSLSGKTPGYSYGDAANVSYVYANGAGVAGSVGAKITSDFTGAQANGGAAFQYQNGSVTKNTSSGLTNYILSFDAKANRAQGGFQIILQTWSGTGYTGTGPLESKSLANVTLGASNVFVHCVFDLGYKLAPGAVATAHTWQIAFVMDEIYFGGTGVGNQLVIDNLAVTMGPPTVGQIWTSTGPAVAAHVYNSSALSLRDGTVLVEGGGFGSGLFAAELYDPVSQTWTATDSLKAGRSYHTATLLADGKVLVTGGYASPQALADTELYDPATHVWTVTGALNSSRFGHTATLLPSGTVLVTGGISSGKFLSSAELYDPASGTWATTESMKEIRFYHTATLLANGTVLVAGGNGNNGASVSSAELFDPIRKTWTPTGSMHQSRANHTATLLRTGEVLAVGSGAELYDPAGSKWTATASAGPIAGNHTATLLPDGRVLVVGGDGSYDLAEIFDRDLETWTMGPLLNVGRSYHLAALLPTGKVLIAGGHDQNLFPLSSAELYDPGIVAVTPIHLENPKKLSTGGFQFGFSGTPGASFNVFVAPNLSTSFANWTALAGVKEVSPGLYEFTDLAVTNTTARFYRVSSAP